MIRGKILVYFFLIFLSGASAGFGQYDPSGVAPPPDDSSANVYDLFEEDDEIKIPRITAFDFDSLLAVSILAPRQNMAADLARSFFHDAGDMMKFDPSNKVTLYQNSPVRTTVSPFGLPGNRVNAIFDGRQILPIGHVVEPDGRLDFNDIPTAHAEQVYNIEGPSGLALGGENAISSLVLIPKEPDTTRIESRLYVDKGTYGYAYTKALFSHRNEKDRLLRLSLGYRKAIGLLTNRDDDAYHHYYELEQPLFRRMMLEADVWLYHRKGSFRPRADSSAIYFTRDRRDRDVNIGMAYNHDSLSQSQVSVRHRRSESILNESDRTYTRYIDNKCDAAVLSHYRKAGPFAAKLRLQAAQENFNDHDEAMNSERERGLIELALHSGDPESNLTLYGKAETATRYDIVPSGEITYIKRSGLFSMSVSAGYATKIPRLYDLYLTPKQGQFYRGEVTDYLESGNENLKAEKQMIGNISLAFGKLGTELALSITGGEITDAIDWVKKDSIDYQSGVFRPINHDIEFINTTIRQKISLGKNVYWSGGGSYHYIEQSDDDEPPYTPEYQAFTNLELYYYIIPLELNLFAYGELLYTGPYTGLNGAELGEEPVFNVKLSFQIKKFRFYYLFQNMLNREYQDREDNYLIGRNNYYGITWEFLD